MRTRLEPQKKVTHPSGGPAAIAGFAYQLLGSIDWVAEIVVQGADRHGGDLAGVTVTFEPSAGGDAVHEHPGKADVVQFKARASGGWTDLALAKDVFPDLMRAARHAAPMTTFRLQTTAPDRRSAAMLRLQTLLEREGPLKGLGIALSEGLRFRGADRQDSLDAEQFVDWIARIGAPKSGKPMSRLQVARFLAHFSVTSALAYDELVARIDERLARVLPFPNEAAQRRKALLGHLVELAAGGDARCSLRTMLEALGLPVADLANNAQLEAALGARLARELGRLGYSRDIDARATSPGDEQCGLRVFGGPSGVGKTWLVAREAEAAQRDGALVVWIDTPGSRQDVRREVTDRVQAARGVQHGRVNPEALGSLLAAISPSAAPYRLRVCLDRFISLKAAASVLTDSWWAEQGIEVVAALPAALGVNISGVVVTEVPEFSARELRDFLTTRGHDWASLAHDVRRLIARPSLARLYLKVAARSPGYRPDTEYELVRQAWTIAPEPATTQWNAARAKLAQGLTAVLKRMLRGAVADYPWPVGAGSRFSPLEVECLERAALMRWTEDHRVVLGHDRLLAWGLAATAADLLSRQQIRLDALADLAARALDPGGDLAGIPRHAVLYFPMDLLWHLTADGVDLAPAVAILRALLDGHRGFEWASVATLGRRGVDLLLTAAEVLDPDHLGLPDHLGISIAEAMGTPDGATATRLAELLQSDEPARVRVALGAYRKAPRRGTLRRLIAVNAKARVAHGKEGDSRDAYLVWDQAFPAARAAALAYPAEFRRVLDGKLSGDEAHTAGWLVLDFPPAQAKALWPLFASHLPKIEEEERSRLAANAARLGAKSDLSRQVAKGVIIGEVAFELMSCVDPLGARKLLATADGATLRAAVGGLELLARTDPDVDTIAAGVIDNGLPSREFVWEMGPWAAVGGRNVWRRLIASADLEWGHHRALDRLAEAPSLDLVPVLEEQSGTAFEATVTSIARTRFAQKQGNWVDHALESAEEVLLRIGGDGFAKQTILRLSDSERAWNDVGVAAAMVSEAPAVQRAYRAFIRRLWATGPQGKVPLQPLDRFAACDPVGARTFAREILRAGRSDAAVYAGHVALKLNDAQLGMAALDRARTQRRAPLRIILNLSVAFEKDAKALAALGRRALRKNSADGRYYAAWIGRHLKDRGFQRRVMAQLLPIIRHHAEQSGQSAFGILLSDPDLRSEILTLVASEPPKSLLAHLIEDQAYEADWAEPEFEDSMVDSAVQFENGFLNTPRDGQERLLEGRLEIGLEVFTEGLRRGGRASAGLAATAIRAYPEEAPPRILAHLLDVEDEKVRIDVGRALRGADWGLMRPLIDERLRSEDARERLTGLEAASWFPGAELEALVLDIRRTDPRGAVQKVAKLVHDRWDVLRFLDGLAKRLPQLGERRRQLLAIMSRADLFSVMRKPGDPLFVDALGLDLRERMIVVAYKNRWAK